MCAEGVLLKERGIVGMVEQSSFEESVGRFELLLDEHFTCLSRQHVQGPECDRQSFQDEAHHSRADPWLLQNRRGTLRERSGQFPTTR